MKYFALSLLLVCTSLAGFTRQEKETPDQIAFEEALDFYYEEEYDSALVYFEGFLQHFPNSSLIPKAKFNIGYMLMERQRREEAIPVFEYLLAANYNEKDPAGGLMEEYALYKHWSAKHLAGIYLDRNDYQKAAIYIRLFDKKYPYQHFCGNEQSANSIKTAYFYARLYEGQGKRKKAIDELLPYIFYDGMASNEYAVAYLQTLLQKEYSREQLKQLALQAKASLKISRSGTATIQYLEKKVPVYEYALLDYSKPISVETLTLSGEALYGAVIDNHQLFKDYIK